jgi:hypothetical protein
VKVVRPRMVPARRSPQARHRAEPGHLLREEHQGSGCSSEHGHRSILERGAVRRPAHRRIRRPRPPEPLRCRLVELGNGDHGDQRQRHHDVGGRAARRCRDTSGTFTGSSAGFTTRIITPLDADIVNDRLATSVGTYSAGATQSGAANWVMQVATFRAAGQLRPASAHRGPLMGPPSLPPDRPTNRRHGPGG